MSQSIYTPLQTTTSIRLFTIRPGELTDTLVVDLHVVELANAPPYTALSYVWGDPEPGVKIQCDGHDSNITPNLADALRQIRAGPRKSFVDLNPSRENVLAEEWPKDPEILDRNVFQGTVLWIDALCIDQANLVERAQQVRMMREIYWHAEKVLIWLGKGDGSTETGLKLILQARYHFQDEPFLGDERGLWPPPILRDYRKLNVGMEQVTCERITPELNLARGLPPPGSEDWAAVGKVYSQSGWFSRKWIVQEVAMSRIAHVLIGDTLIDWDNFPVATYWLSNKAYAIGVKFLQDAGFAFILGLARNCRDPANKRFYLLDVMTILSFWKTTDPRDHLYGVLGLAEETRDLVRCPTLAPDYKKSLRDVYLDLAQFILENDRGYDDRYGRFSAPGVGLLNFVTHQHRNGSSDDEYPSWVPRWDLIGTRNPWLSDGTGDFTASKDSRADVKFTADGLGLLVQGLSLDEVRRADQSLCKARGDVQYVQHPMWPTVRDLWQSISISEHSGIYESEEMVKDAFAATITAGINTSYPAESPKTGFGRLDFEDYILEHTQQAENSRAPPNQAISPLSPSSEIKRSRAEQLGHTVNFEYAVGMAIFRESFFTTEKGYFGIGPQILEAGDLIMIPFGAKTPLAIRRKDTSYWLVGECYVHGIMSGEAIDEFEAGKLKEEWFEIR